MKIALAAAVIALAGAAPHATVLGWDYDSKRISWYDAGSLSGAGSASTTWFRPLCSWSFSPDRRRLALSDCNGMVREAPAAERTEPRRRCAPGAAQIGRAHV